MDSRPRFLSDPAHVKAVVDWICQIAEACKDYPDRKAVERAIEGKTLDGEVTCKLCDYVSDGILYLFNFHRQY